MIAKENQISENDLLKLVLDFKDFAVIIIRPNREIFVWNNGAAGLYGYAAEDMTGQLITTVYKDEQTAAQHEYYLEQAEKYGRVEYESWETKKDNSQFYASSIIITLYQPNGAIKGFAKVCRDISVVKKLADENALLKQGLEEKVRQRTKELEVVNKELEAFSYSVSHDLRTPLRAIIGYSAMLQEDYEMQLDQEANRIIGNIVNNTKMMGQLIDDLLTFSKMARLEVMNEAIDMKDLATSCLQKFTANW